MELKLFGCNPDKAEMRVAKHGFNVIKNLKINHMDLGNVILLTVQDTAGCLVKRYN